MLNKTFLSGSFYSKCGEWITNGHWAIKVSAYKLAKAFEEGLRSPPDMTSILPKASAKLPYAVEWSDIETVQGMRYGRILRKGAKDILTMGGCEYLDKLTPEKGYWWTQDEMSPMYLTISYSPQPTFKAEDVIAVLMPCQVGNTHELKALAALAKEG